MVLGGILCNKHHAKTIGTKALADDISEVEGIYQDKTSTKTCVVYQQQANLHKETPEQLLLVV
ncbi:hypothetical protein [Cylindrospermum sp. FACHB-282]|uniref:hypothetical protein n=1 Tax=Cylindrospermum sp. FACHB-282 TaxID=2692794 RepID=UPI001684D809|nr:hypothetical protein [Cylindrospermum sp. FACHB-282]MBD2386667.1 hypothetical protein [Cylindrospermum sp. FACHB-282]